MNLGISAFIACLLLLNTSARAQDVNENDPYYQISTVKTEITDQFEGRTTTRKLERAYSDFAKQNMFNVHGYEATHASVDPMAIAELLFKVWDIVKDGKPVLNINLKSASALPNLAANQPLALTGWKDERAISYRIVATNLMGIDVVDFTYYVKLIYGGGVRDKGRYIASARVVPGKIELKWGFNLDVNASIPAIINKGSEEDPLAAIYLDVNYKIHTVFSSSTESQSYYVQGDGLFIDNDSKKVFFPAVPRTR